jgi:EGF-like domain.
LYSETNYPSGRYSGIFLKTREGMMIYSGLYTIHTNLSETDPSTENYLTYATNCLETLNFYGVSIYSIGTPSFAVKQAQFYNLTGNACFLQSSPVPNFYGNIQFLQGVWFLNFTHCPSNCSNHGFCEYGSCYCNDGFFGEFCEYLLCPGSFCIYDDEFFLFGPMHFFVLGMEVVITVLVNVLETTLEMTALVLAVRITAMNEGAAFQCILFLNVIVMENTEETLAMSLFA